MREANFINPILNTEPVKDPDKRLREIAEEEKEIRKKMDVLEKKKSELLKELQEDIGEKGTQDVLQKLWKQKHKGTNTNAKE